MILILGTPGAGKTTQTRLLAGHLDWKWFSMGDLIRREVKGKDRQEMLAGKIIDDQVTLDIVDKTLAKIDFSREDCVFEGNPRSVPQAKWWMQQVNNGRFKIQGIIHLVASLAIAEQRINQRGRLDDHDDNVVETRMEQYKRSIKPTLKYLEKSRLGVHEINADGTIEEVAAAINKVLGV
jgi:adenylate kinase